MQEPLTANTLDDLAVSQVLVTVTKPDGAQIKVPVRILGESEVREHRKRITWPKAPITGYGSGGTPQYGWQDTDYLKAVDDANHELTLALVTASIAFDIPGETEADKRDYLSKKLGMYVFLQLVEAVEKLNTISQGEIAAVARSFRPARNGSLPGDGAARVDSGAVG